MGDRHHIAKSFVHTKVAKDSEPDAWSPGLLSDTLHAKAPVMSHEEMAYYLGDGPDPAKKAPVMSHEEMAYYLGDGPDPAKKAPVMSHEEMLALLE